MAEINPEGVSEIEASNAEKKQKIIRIRVGNVLKRWLTDHYHDYHDPQLLSRLESGIAEIQEQQLQGTLKKTIQEQQLQKNKIRDLMFSKEKPMPILPKGQTFDDWDVIEVARQLCLYEQTIYQSIHPKEALNQAWNKHKERAPNIIKMISFFNRISKWVSTQICHREDYKARVKLIMKFMMLTMQLRQYNNFDCMQAVLSGLNNSSVFRMKASWAKIQKDKLYSQWKQMADHITDTTNNSHNYRAAVTHADPPIIPYLGVYLTDLTFTEDGNSDYLRVQGGREDIINFEKMRRVAVVIKDICTYQQTPYNFERVPLIYDFFAGDLQYEDDNALFKRSRALEPPDTNNPGQVITPKKAKKSLSFRRVSLGVFSSKDKDSDGDSSPKGSPKSKDKKDKDKKK
jgi:son of sevenless-like protein